jgi:hypothetical protein
MKVKLPDGRIVEGTDIQDLTQKIKALGIKDEVVFCYPVTRAITVTVIEK